MSSSSGDDIPQNIKDMEISDSDSEEEKQNSSQNQQQQQQDEQENKQDEVREKLQQETEKLKEKGLKGMDLLKQKVAASKEKIQDFKENLQKDPTQVQKMSENLVEEAKNNVQEIKGEAQNLQKETIASVGAVAAAGIASTQLSKDESKTEQDTEEDNPPMIKPRPQRIENAISQTLDAQSCMKIRKESYEILKFWDDKCLDYFNYHRVVAEAAFSRIERRLKISIESMKNIIIYFQNKATFESAYYKAHLARLPKLSMAYKDLQDSNTIMYPVLSQGLQECDDMNDQQAKLVSIFTAYIEKNILKDMLIYDAQDFEKKVSNQIEKVKRARVRAIAASKDYNKHSQKYQKLYHDLLVTEGKAKKREKDFYNIELKFKKATIDYMIAERKLGQEITKLWVDGRKIENHRMSIIKRGFKMYLEKYEQTYGVRPSMNQAVEYWETFDFEQEVQSNFSINSILNNEDQLTLKKGLSKKPDDVLELKDAEYYLSKFSHSELDKYSKLVLQTFTAERDVATVKKQFKRCELVVTIDDFLLFFDDFCDTEIKKANKKLHMNKISVKKIKNHEQELYIIEKIPGMVLNTYNKLLVRFESISQQTEFVEYVSNFCKVDTVDK